MPVAEGEIAAFEELQRRRAELRVCAADPIHFIRTYCKTYDPRLSGERIIPFDLFDVQERCIRFLQDCDRHQHGGIIEKSRDSGASYICCAYALWGWMFIEGDATGFGSYKLDKVDTLGDPDSLFEKIRMLLRGLPDWMMPKGFNERKHSGEAKLINPSNGSTITGEGGDDIGRGGRRSRYFVDEAAHVDHPALIDASLSQTTNVRIDVSTPHGLDAFYRKKQSGSVPIFRLHWMEDPRKNHWEERDRENKVVGRGSGRHPTAPIPTSKVIPKENKQGITVVYPWYERERSKPEYRDPSILAQEVDIDYVGTGHSRYNREWLMEARDKIYPSNAYAAGWEPLRVELPGRSAWQAEVTTYKEAENRHTYITIADTARGLTESGESDYSVAHVYDLETCEMVCHYRGRPVENEFAFDLVTLCTLYNNALLVVETPGPGEAVLSVINAQQHPYPYLYSYWDDDAAMGGKALRYGLPMTPTTKPESEAKLAGLLYDAEQGIKGSILIRHPNTFEELIHYVVIRMGICGAEAGGHDDEVTCCRLLAMVWAQFTTRGQRKPGELEPAKPRTVSPSSMRTRNRSGR